MLLKSKLNKFWLLSMLLLISTLSFSQSSNFRAQGKYYSAKEKFEQNKFNDALNYIYQSKKNLNGGSNYKLQYIHIIAAYKAGRFQEAQKEMKRYFNLIDKKEKPIAFEKYVERLTSDETKAITKLIDKIDEAVVQFQKNVIINNNNAKKLARLNNIKNAFKRFKSFKVIKNYELYDYEHTFDFVQLPNNSIKVNIKIVETKYKADQGPRRNGYSKIVKVLKEKNITKYTLVIANSQNLKYRRGFRYDDNKPGIWSRYEKGIHANKLKSDTYIISGFTNCKVEKLESTYFGRQRDNKIIDQNKTPLKTTDRLIIEVKGFQDYDIKNLVNVLKNL